MKKFSVLFISTFISFFSWSQGIEFDKKDVILQGFAEKISGHDIDYHSSVASANHAMIVRAGSGSDIMEWETQTIPDEMDGKDIYLVWLSGIGCNLGTANMYLSLNDQEIFNFETSSVKHWDIDHPEGYKLIFSADFEDGSRDLFGFMYLKIPGKFIHKGEKFRLKVRGGKDNSQAWYMCFQSRIRSGMNFNAFPAIFNEEGTAKQLIAADIFHFGLPSKAKIFINNKLFRKVNLDFGSNYFRFGWPVVEDEENINIRLETKDFRQEMDLLIKPVRKWKVNFVQHSHTDIGYTRSQSEILAEHLRYIDYALDYCDATDDFPDDAKFRWTCEVSWPVERYLKTRPRKQIDRLKQRIKEGRIEVSGMYLNFDEMPDEQTLAQSLLPFKTFKDEGINVQLAMQNDVNGIAWCFADYFKDLGVKYLNMGTHGHKALIPFDYPTLFWWESPSGNRLLAFRAEHYMTGNTFGIHSTDFKAFESKFLHYLIGLEAKGYPYDITAIQHSGYTTDNSPPSTLSSSIIKEWNIRYEWPKLRAATGSEFFKEVEEAHAEDFPVIRGAWPDWWTDGFASGAREAAKSRETHSDIISNQGLLFMANLMGSDLSESIYRDIFEVNNSLLFYDEHTFGSSESVRSPFSKASMEQRALKESYVWEAYRRSRLIGEEGMGLLQIHFDKDINPSILVFNTMGSQRSGLVKLYIDHQLLSKDAHFKILDKDGNICPAQNTGDRSDGSYWSIFVPDVPALGYKRLFILTDKNEKYQGKEKKQTSENCLENQWYRIEVDTVNACINSIKDKTLNLELVDQESSRPFASFIHEKLPDRTQLDAYYLSRFERLGLNDISYLGYSEGAVWNSMRFHAESESLLEPNGYSFEIRLYHLIKRIDFCFELQKKSITDPESIYIAFPFQLNRGKMYFDVPGGSIEAGKDQIPGSANDWNTIQNFVSIQNEQAQIITGSQEIPIMQLGNINTGRFKAGARPEKMHVYAWPMNNYWVTNFNAEQRGSFDFSFYLSSTSNNSLSQSSNFAWNTRIPMYGRVIPSGTESSTKDEGSLIAPLPENVLLISARPLANRKFLLQIRETGGLDTDFTIHGYEKDLKIYKSNPIGDTMDSLDTIKIKAFESRFFILSW